MRASYHRHKTALHGFDVLIMPRRAMPDLKSFVEVDNTLAELYETAKTKVIS
jgi:RNase P protein component